MRFQQHSDFLDRGEGFAVQQFVAQLAVEALLDPILPRAARIDVMGRGAAGLEPRLNLGSDELGAVVAADEPWERRAPGTAASEQRPFLFWVRDIADRRPRDFQEAAGPPLRQAAFCGVGDVASLLLDGIIGLG